MGVVREVIHRRSVAEVHMNQYTQFLEVFERPVNRAHGNIGMHPLHAGCKVLGGRMVTRSKQCIDNCTPRCGYPPARIAQHLQNFRRAGVVGRAERFGRSMGWPWGPALGFLHQRRHP